MADPIPSSDAALLAAQAKGGQAGVDAYQAAKQEMERQRQQQIQQAMQEAALRGAPGGAIGSLQSTITAPYDEAISSMTQRSADYQASNAAADRRLGDYSASVQMARSLIPGQVEMEVAPIRAENNYRLRLQQQQSDQRIAEIRANTDLETARLNAAIDAAKRKAAAEEARQAAEDARRAAEDAKLNVGEASSMINQGAAGILGDASSSINSLLAANKGKVGDEAGYIGARVGQAASRQDQRLQAESIGGRLAQMMLYAAARKEEDRQKQAGRPPQQHQPPFAPGVGGPNPAAYAPGGAYGPPTERPGFGTGPQGSFTPAPAPTRPPPVDYTLINKAKARFNELAPMAPRADEERKQLAARALFAGLQGIGKSYADYSSVGPGGNRVLASQSQIANLDPFAQKMLMGGVAQGSIMDPVDFGAVLGDPTRDLRDAGRQARLGQPVSTAGGVGSPYSSDLVNAAMWESAKGLKGQGYNLTDAEVQNAMPDKTPSVYNFLGARSDQPSSEDFYKQNVGAMSDATTTADKSDEQSASQALIDTYGHSGNDRLGSALSVLDFTEGASNPSTQAQFEEAKGAIADIVDQWDSKYQPKYGSLDGPALRRALQSHKTAMGDKLTPRAIEIAMNLVAGY